MSANQFKFLEDTIRDILDRNSFSSQKVKRQQKKVPSSRNKQKPPPEAFRIRVTQPLRFAVEIVKPIPLHDFLFIAGRINISPQHQQAIMSLSTNSRLDLYDDLRSELGRKPPTTQFHFAEGSQTLAAIEAMVPIIVNEQDLVKDLFQSMDVINKSFFTVVFILQRHFRKVGVKISADTPDNSSNPLYQ